MITIANGTSKRCYIAVQLMDDSYTGRVKKHMGYIGFLKPNLVVGCYISSNGSIYFTYFLIFIL